MTYQEEFERSERAASEIRIVFQRSQGIITEEFKRHPDAFRALLKFYDIPKATPATAARYIFVFGSKFSWWASVGAPHLNLMTGQSNCRNRLWVKGVPSRDITKVEPCPCARSR